MSKRRKNHKRRNVTDHIVRTSNFALLLFYQQQQSEVRRDKCALLDETKPVTLDINEKIVVNLMTKP
jgi:hypothetical protein